MRILFSNRKHPANVAKSLKKALSRRGRDLTLSRCQQVVAVMCGYRDWYELASVPADPAAASLPDALCPVETATARRAQYVAAIAALGIADEVAREIVAEASPTGFGSPASVAPSALSTCRRAVELGMDRHDYRTAEGMPLTVDLLKRCHAAILQTPFWSERRVWRHLGRRDATAEALLRPFLRDIRHSDWMPGMALTLASCGSNLIGFVASMSVSPGSRSLQMASQRVFARKYIAAGKAFQDGPVAAESYLAGIDEDFRDCLVGAVDEFLAVNVMKAAGIEGENDDIVTSVVKLGRWRKPDPFQPTPYVFRDWTELDELAPSAESSSPRFEVRRVDAQDDPDVRALATQVDDAAAARMAAFFDRRAGRDAERFLLLARPGDADAPTAALAVRRAVDREFPSVSFDFGGCWFAAEEPESMAALALALAGGLQDDLFNWERILPPGSVLTVSVRPSSGDAMKSGDRDLAIMVEGLVRTLVAVRDAAENANLPVAITISRTDDEVNDIDRPLPEPLVIPDEAAAPLARIGALRAAAFAEDRPFALLRRGGRGRIFWQGEASGRRSKARIAVVREIESMPFDELMRPVAEAAGMERPALLVGRSGSLYAVEEEALGEFWPADGDWGSVVTVLTAAQAADRRALPPVAREFWSMFEAPDECIYVGDEEDAA